MLGVKGTVSMSCPRIMFSLENKKCDNYYLLFLFIIKLRTEYPSAEAQVKANAKHFACFRFLKDSLHLFSDFSTMYGELFECLPFLHPSI